jgi:predicted ribosome quality control (RQC) complex YloA/Tae2 family protein
LFSYFSKDRIISILERLKRDPSVPYEGYIISEADYATNVVFFNDVLDKYIDVFNRSKTADIVAAEVDQERLRNTDTRLTNEFLGHCLKMFCLNTSRLLKIQNVIATGW